MLLDLSDAPKDPVERLMWLGGVHQQVVRELDAAFGDAYFNARLQGRFDTAVEAGPYARKRALAYTRHENERRGRTVKWGDGADPTSSAYQG